MSAATLPGAAGSAAGKAAGPTTARWADARNLRAQLQFDSQMRLQTLSADPGLAARVGFSVDLGLDTRLDLAVGGGPVLYAADTEAELGFVGGGRLTLRFGGTSEARAP
mgnify:CR=1 FL=1